MFLEQCAKSKAYVKICDDGSGCRYKSCNGYPNAVCKLDACDQCKAKFYIKNREAKCKPGKHDKKK